jgi:arsenate reductase-like glutaredoxin family protein
MFEVENNEVKFIYNSDKISDRETYAYLKSLHQHVINEIDIAHNDLTSTQLSELANKLNVRIIDLFDRSSQGFKNNLEGKDVQEEDLLMILQKDRDAFKTPIIITSGVSKHLPSSAETISWDMIFTNTPPQDEQKD